MYNNNGHGARSTMGLVAHPFLPEAVSAKNARSVKTFHPLVHFGLKDKKWIALDLGKGISHGLDKTDGYMDVENDVADYERYLEDGHFVKSKRSLKMRYARAALQDAMAAARGDDAAVDEHTGIPNEVVMTAPPRAVQTDTDSLDKDVAELEYMFSKHARVAVAEAVRGYRGQPEDEIFDLSKQQCMGSQSAIVSDDFVTQDVGFMRFDVFLPETAVKPDPVVPQFMPRDVGAPSAYNPDLTIFANPAHQTRQNENLRKKALRAKADQEVQARLAKSSRGSAVAEKPKPVGEKKEPFVTKLTRILAVDENGVVTQSEPITDATRWIDCPWRKWKVRGYVHAELYQASTSVVPQWGPRWRAVEIFFFDPVETSFGEGVRTTTVAGDDDDTFGVFSSERAIADAPYSAAVVPDAAPPSSPKRTASDDNDAWSEPGARAQPAKRSVAEAHPENAGRIQVLPDAEEDEVEDADDQEMRKRFDSVPPKCYEESAHLFMARRVPPRVNVCTNKTRNSAPLSIFYTMQRPTRPVLNVFMAPNPRLSPYVAPVNAAWHRRTVRDRPQTWAQQQHLVSSLRRHQPLDYRTSLAKLERDAARLQRLITRSHHLFRTEPDWFSNTLPQLGKMMALELPRLIDAAMHGGEGERVGDSVQQVLFAAGNLTADAMQVETEMRRALLLRLRSYREMPEVRRHAERPEELPPAMALEPSAFTRLVEDTYAVALNLVADVWQVVDTVVRGTLEGGAQYAIEHGDRLRATLIREQVQRPLTIHAANPALDLLLLAGVPSHATLTSNIGEIMVRRVARAVTTPSSSSVFPDVDDVTKVRQPSNARAVASSRTTRLIRSAGSTARRSSRRTPSIRRTRSAPGRIRTGRPYAAVNSRKRTRFPSREAAAARPSAMAVDDEHSMSRSPERNKRVFQ